MSKGGRVRKKIENAPMNVYMGDSIAVYFALVMLVGVESGLIWDEG